jgi:integrase
LLGWKWSDVDLDAGTLSVQRSLDANGAFNPPKRNKSRRTVKLTSQAVEALKLHRKRQNEERLKAARWEDHGLVFPNRVGKPMDHDNLYHRDFNSLLKRVGLWSEDKGKRSTSHSLRHTCATLLHSKTMKSMPFIYGHKESRRADSNRLPLLITSDRSRVAGVCTCVQIPHF